MASLTERGSHPPADWFGETHWSVVLAAGGGASLPSRKAIETLCRQYWQPLYAYVRRKGCNPHEAEDLTQEFFACLLSRNDFAGLHPDHGKFRAFLLAAMNHFLAKDWRKASAQKRGGRLSSFAPNEILPLLHPPPDSCGRVLGGQAEGQCAKSDKLRWPWFGGGRNGGQNPARIHISDGT